MVKEIAKEIRKKFSELGADVPQKEIESKLDLLVNQYKVPEEEARRTVFNQYVRDLKLHRTSSGDSPLTKVKDITSDGRWISMKARVVQLWENEKPSISQIGLLGDETGKSYIFNNLVTDSWQGRFSVKMNKTTTIVPTEDVEVASSDSSITGAIVDVQSGSGLVKRCPECNRILIKGACVDHGKQEGEYDLRVKAVIDDGRTAQDIILNQEMTYKVTGIDVKVAKKMAMDAVDPAVVLDEIKRILLGKYFTVKGPVLGSRYLLVKDMQRSGAQLDQDAVAEKVEGI
jgi:replication factor A1